MGHMPYLLDLPAGFRVELALARIGSHPHSFCLDAGPRHTFLGLAPVATFSSVDGFVTRRRGHEAPHIQIDQPIEALRHFADCLSSLPEDHYLPFYGGLVGYVSFEWGAKAQRIDRAHQGTMLPDAWFGLFDTVAVFDHVERTCYIASLGLDEAMAPRQALAQERAEQLLALMSEPSQVTSPPYLERELEPDDLAPVSPLRRYREIAQTLQHHLWQGLAQKLNLAQRYVGLMQEEPWAVHARLREHNPTPHSAFLNLGEYQLSSTSPTCFLSLQGRELMAKPVLAHRFYHHPHHAPDVLDDMAHSTEATGTLHRLQEEFAPLACGRVTLDIPQVETDRQAAHLACNLRLQLQSPLTILDALARLVPGLSMTGYPKPGALQLLAHHEPFPRHAYTGAMGYWAPNARAQFNLCVRLLTMHEGLGYVHAASWLDARTPFEETLEQTNGRVTHFFSRLHSTPITTIHEQSLY
ncbi:MAG: chorismate-binding protein [Deltaproteobacteria bacterium]|nr:chorismate-binding protein [Deltaproteobacteria bacterium]